jgi:hypothetical protein
MKKLLLCFLVSASLIACTNPLEKNSTEDANMATFRENSKIVKTLLDGFVTNEFDKTDSLISDTAKFDSPGLGVGILNKTENLTALRALRALDTEVSYTELQFLPTVDTATLKPDGNVRVFAKWSAVGQNGAIVNNKYFAVFEFNTDHKLIYVDAYQDMTGIMQALTAPSKK